MGYTKQTWNDNASGGTPITAARLNHIEEGIYQIGASIAHPIRQGKYVKLSKTMTQGQSYTVPADGWYVLSCSNDKNYGANAWFMVDNEPIFGGYVEGANNETLGTVPIAKGTVVTTRSNVPASYTIQGYYPW